MANRYRSGWWLEIKYWEEGLTQREIAECCDVSPRTIRKYMDRYGIERRDQRGEDHPLAGKPRAESVREQISDTLSGRTMDEDTRERMAEAHRGRSLSEERRAKIADSLSGSTPDESTRQRMSESTAGPQNPNWRGGYSRRYGPGWSVAREAVRDRDEICQHCGHDGSERRLEVHHIEPVRQFRDDPDRDLASAHVLENLVLLCRTCHAKADHGTISVDPPEGDVDTERR